DVGIAPAATVITRMPGARKLTYEREWPRPAATAPPKSSGERHNIDMRGEIDRSGIIFSGGGHPGLRGGLPGELDTRDGVPLDREQRMADWVRARPDVDTDGEPLSFGKIIRGMVLGDWRGAEPERRTMLGAVDPSVAALTRVTRELIEDTGTAL